MSDVVDSVHTTARSLTVPPPGGETIEIGVPATYVDAVPVHDGGGGGGDGAGAGVQGADGTFGTTLHVGWLPSTE